MSGSGRLRAALLANCHARATPAGTASYSPVGRSGCPLSVGVSCTHTGHPRSGISVHSCSCRVPPSRALASRRQNVGISPSRGVSGRTPAARAGGMGGGGILGGGASSSAAGGSLRRPGPPSYSSSSSSMAGGGAAKPGSAFGSARGTGAGMGAGASGAAGSSGGGSSFFIPAGGSRGGGGGAVETRGAFGAAALSRYPSRITLGWHSGPVDPAGALCDLSDR